MNKRIAIFFILSSLFINLFHIETLRAGGVQNFTEAGFLGLDLSAGYINGDRCEYIMNIPDDWLEYLLIEREDLPPGTRIVEKLNIYFLPKTAYPIILSNIFIFETRYSDEVGSYKRILETDEYDFRAYVSAAEPELSSAGEKIMFNHIIGQLGDVNFVSELFVFPEGKGQIIKERLFVNGTLTDGAVIHNGSRPFVPLRAACEALGYSLVWYGDDASVYIEKGDFEFTLHFSGGQNFGAVRVENNFYVPALFFIQVLRTSFETDRRGNVFVTERG